MKLCYCVGNPVKLAKAPEEAPTQPGMRLLHCMAMHDRLRQCLHLNGIAPGASITCKACSGRLSSHAYTEVA